MKKDPWFHMVHFLLTVFLRLIFEAKSLPPTNYIKQPTLSKIY